MLTLLAGLLTGVLLSAPIGPMGALAAYHAARKHVRAATTLAIGACLADAFLALMASFGATSVPVASFWLSLAIAILMGGMAVYLWRVEPHGAAPPDNAASLLVGFSGTILHVGNLVAFGLAFGWLHHQGLGLEGILPRVMLSVGVFCGAFGMWWAMIMAAKRFGQSSTFQRFERYLVRGLSIGCMLTALWALSKLF